MTFKSCFVEQSIPAHTAVPSLRVLCRIRLIEHSLNWINHILHAGAQAPLNRLEYEVAKHLGVVGGAASNQNPGRVGNPWVCLSDCCHSSLLISLRVLSAGHTCTCVKLSLFGTK